RLVSDLVVGRIEFDLVVVQEHQWPLVVRRRADAAFLGERRGGGHRGSRAQQGAPVDPTGRRGFVLFHRGLAFSARSLTKAASNPSARTGCGTAPCRG